MTEDKESLDKSKEIYSEIIFMLNNEIKDDYSWFKALEHFTGSRITRAPCPLVEPNVVFTAEEVVLGHILAYSRFHMLVLSLTPKEFPIARLEHILSCFNKLERCGGWKIYWETTRYLQFFYTIAQTDKIIDFDENKAWGEQMVFFPNGPIKMLNWIGEAVAFFNFIIRAGYQTYNISKSAKEEGVETRSIVYHSDGHLTLASPGIVHMMGDFNDLELKLMEYFCPIFLKFFDWTNETLVEFKKGLRGLNGLAVQALLCGCEQFFVDFYIAIQGTKVLSTLFDLKDVKEILQKEFIANNLEEFEEYKKIFSNIPKPAPASPTKH